MWRVTLLFMDPVGPTWLLGLKFGTVHLHDRIHVADPFGWNIRLWRWWCPFERTYWVECICNKYDWSIFWTSITTYFENVNCYLKEAVELIISVKVITVTGTVLIYWFKSKAHNGSELLFYIELNLAILIQMKGQKLFGWL